MKKTLNDIILEENINTLNIPIVIDFWAPWCTPCKILNNTIKEIKYIFKNNIKIIKINIDLNYFSTEKFSVKNIPTILIVKNKIIIAKKQGNITKEYIKNLLEKII